MRDDRVGGLAPAPGLSRDDRKRVRSPRNVRLIADVGLLLLPALLVEILTGLILFAFGRGIVPKDSAAAQAAFDFLASVNLLRLQDVGFQTNVHVWAGYLSTGAILVKAVASWPTLRGWWPRRFSPLHLLVEKTAAWALIALAPASYVTGGAISLHLISLHDRLIRDLHLWISVLLILVLAWHTWHFLPTGLRVMAVQIKRARTHR